MAADVLLANLDYNLQSPGTTRMGFLEYWGEYHPYRNRKKQQEQRSS